MKKIILMLLFAFSFSAIAQEANDIGEIKINGKEGIVPLVVQAEGVTAQQMYDRVKYQITKMFKNPDKVIKADQQGTLIRFSGFETYKGGLSTSGDYFYTCELEFKDGRYRISFYDVYRNTSFQDVGTCFNKEGEPRSMQAYKNMLNNFTDLVNKVHQTYKGVILSKDQSGGW